MTTKWLLPDGQLKMEFELDRPESRTGIVEINSDPDHPGKFWVDIMETNAEEDGGFYFGAKDMTIPQAMEYARRAVKLLNKLHCLSELPEFM